MQDEAIDPSRATTTSSVRVRFCETDLMGIVHHATYLVYFEAGRVEWFRRRGLSHAEWSHVHLPVVEARVNYRAPAKFDDVLDVHTSLAELRTVSLKFAYTIERGGVTIADGVTRLGCLDAAYNVLRIPLEMRSVLLSGEISSPAPP